MELAIKRPESVLVVIHTVEKILLLKRRDNPSFWQSVTGSMLSEEVSPLVTAWRELKEETGFTSSEGIMQDCQYANWFDIYQEWQHRYAEGVKRNLEHVFCFKMNEQSMITLSKEHDAYDWVTKEEALSRVFSQTNYDAIVKFVGA